MEVPKIKFLKTKFKLKERFEYDKESLSFIKISAWKYHKIKIFLASFILFVGTISGIYISSNTTIKIFNSESRLWEMPSKHDIILGSAQWKDSVFSQYTVQANIYLSRPEYKNTPIKAEMLSLAAHNAYDSTGILLPVELALTQCQWESGMGLKGRSPVNNPFNIGEYDSGTVIWFDDTFSGIQAYYYFMCNNYLSCRTLEQLFTNFVNCNGKRYASGEYEAHVPKQYYYIKNWLKQETKKIFKKRRKK